MLDAFTHLMLLSGGGGRYNRLSAVVVSMSLMMAMISCVDYGYDMVCRLDSFPLSLLCSFWGCRGEKLSYIRPVI